VETVIVAGIMKATRLVDATTVVTVVAFVVVVVPPAAGDMLTVTEAGWIVPAGKPEPVRVMLVMPGCPESGRDGRGEGDLSLGGGGDRRLRRLGSRRRNWARECQRQTTAYRLPAKRRGRLRLLSWGRNWAEGSR
jgi:hypothetical protein